MGELDLDGGADEAFCYLTTLGRRTREPHEIEIWFSTDGRAIHLISGGADRSDWVQNLLANPSARVRLKGVEAEVVARLPMPVGDERSAAIVRLHDKYEAQVAGSAADWEARAYMVALDPQP